MYTQRLDGAEFYLQQQHFFVFFVLAPNFSFKSCYYGLSPKSPKKDYTSVFDASFSWKHYSWLQLQACSAPDEHQQHNQKPDQKHTLFKNIYMELLQIVKVQE